MTEQDGPKIVELRNGEIHHLTVPEGPFDLENAAHQLAGIARWSAGTDPYLTLASHLVGCKTILEEAGAGPETQFYGITHDYPERITGDMPHPLKYMRKDEEVPLSIDPDRLDRELLEEKAEDLPMPVEKADSRNLLELYQALGAAFGIRFKDYMEPVEENLLTVVYEEVGLEGPTEEQEKTIKQADLAATAYELLDAEEEYRATALETWEDDYEKRVREKIERMDSKEIPDWLHMDREESKEAYITTFRDLEDQL